MIERGGKFLNDGGEIADRLYAVGWARRGPTGTIGTNRPDGYEVADQIAAAMPPGALARPRRARQGLKRLLESRGVMPTDYDDWRKIEETETANARPGSPAREVRPGRALAGHARPLAPLALSQSPHLSSRGLGSRRDRNVASSGFRSGSSSAW